MTRTDQPPPTAPPIVPPEIREQLGDEVTLWLSDLLLKYQAALDRIRELEEEVRKLKAQLGRDSTSSSRPPSSDPPASKAKRKKLRKRRRKPSGRSPGGQPGHKGTTRQMHPVEEADDVRHRFPETCGGCGTHLDGAKEAGAPLPHQLYELPPVVLELIHVWLHRLSCPHCGQVTTATLPQEESTGQGPRLTAFIGLLIGSYRLSREQVASLLNDLFGVRIATGTVQACWERVGQSLAGPQEELLDALRNVDAAHFDETGWFQGGERRWMWVATTLAYALFLIRPSRGAVVLRELFPDGFDGIANSDRWSAYSFFAIDKRQLCWAHLIRDIQAIIDAKGTGAERAKKIMAGVNAMFHTWHGFIDDQFDRSSLQGEVAAFREDLKDFCDKGNAQEKDDLWRKLGKSLLKLWPAVFLFIDVEGVEPTNNLAERDVRHGVIWRKLTAGTRSDTGSTCVHRAMSVIATCRKQGIGILDYFTQALSFYWKGIPPPHLLPKEPATT